MNYVIKTTINRSVTNINFSKQKNYSNTQTMDKAKNYSKHIKRGSIVYST